MTEKLIQQENIVPRFRRLMLLRVIVVTFLLGITAFLQVKGAQQLQPGYYSPIYSIIIATYFLSFLYILFLKVIKNYRVNAYIQAICDISTITVLVYVTGGINSVYTALYNLVIIYSALLLTKKGGLVAAAAASLFYSLLVGFESYGVLAPYAAPIEYGYSAGYVLSRIFFHIVSFYIVALLVSFVAEQEKKFRFLLTEKESEFDQLDLLHKSIIDHVNAGIVTIDLERRIKSFNKTAEEISGRLFSDVVGKPINSMLPGLDETLENRKNIKGALETTKSGELVVSGMKDGMKTLGFSISHLVSSKGERIGNIIIFQDLTSTKEMEKEVEKSKNLALIGEMAAGLAHEIRNPLTALSGSIQLLKKNLDLSKTDARLMEIVLRGREQLENLVSNFLLLAKPDVADRENIDINNMLENILESLHHCPDWHENIAVQLDLCNKAGIYGNRTEIKQMLWNLALNAVQAMPEGGTLSFSTRVTVSEKGKDSLEITVDDTGCGIELDLMGKILKPFYSTKEKGTGLGLAIVNRIAEGHGGVVKIESELGAGSTCTLLFPININLPRNDTDFHGNLKNGKTVV